MKKLLALILSIALVVGLASSAAATTAGDTVVVEPVMPSMVEATLYAGESITVEKSVHVPEVPPVVDVVFAVDLTGSMGGEIAQVKKHITAIISALAALPGVDLQGGLVSHVDYPGYYSSCGYSGTYGVSGEWPFRVEKAVTSDFAAVDAAAQAMPLKYGADGPESYARVMWESAQADSGIGYRAGAFKVLVFFLDSVPHDCNLNEGVPGTSGTWSAGVDPGRNALIDGYLGTGGDDIDLQDHAIADMIAKNVRQITMYSGSSARFKYWDHWSGLTGGSAFQLDYSGKPPAGLDLATVICDEVKKAAAAPLVVTPVPVGCDPLVVTFDPPESDPAKGCETVFFDETIAVPEETEPGIYCCTVEFRADGAVIGIQEICITVVPKVIEVVIDIKPGSFPNSINPDSKGVIPLAILTTSTTAGEPVTFDATTVDAATVRFGPAEAEAVHWALEDVDNDGDIDMILHFKTQETGIQAGDTEAELTGQTTDGRAIHGVDSVRTVPPRGKGK